MADAALELLSRDLTEQGRLIEAGWIGLRIAALPAETPPEQLLEMRNVFFAGAHFLFASIITLLEPGEEPTAADLKRMSLIDAELRAFIEVFTARHLPTKGSA